MIVRFGNSQSLDLTWPATTEVGDFAAPRGEPLADVALAVAKSLVQPIDFPPLASAVVPGDRVVIAMKRAMPSGPAIIAGMVASLLTSGVEPTDITVVTTEDGAADLLAGLPTSLRGEVRQVVHDPDNAESMAYLAASHDAHPINVNRILVDADLLIPVTTLRPTGSLGDLGVAGGIFPAFSDRATQIRYRPVDRASWRKHAARSQRDIDEMLWLLGVQLSVGVVPASDGGVLAVVAGRSESVAKQGRALADAAWSHPIDQRYDVVVAAIDGGPDQQTWNNVARALDAAAGAAADHGAIVVCSSLHHRPGPALRHLARAGTPEIPKKKGVKRDTPSDSAIATLLHELSQDYRLYLLSELDEETVDPLGMAYVESPDDIQHLVQRFSSCLVLGGAQYAAIAETQGAETRDAE